MFTSLIRSIHNSANQQITSIKSVNNVENSFIMFRFKLVLVSTALGWLVRIAGVPGVVPTGWVQAEVRPGTGP